MQAEGIDEEAAQYLRAVREEASKIPHVTVSKTRAPPRAVGNSTEAIEAAMAVPDEPSLPPPIIEWTYGVIQSFVEARNQVEYMVRFSACAERLAFLSMCPCAQS